MQKRTEYAERQEINHKRKIILPNVISWEYGSNKFASQKGLPAFGTIRNTIVFTAQNLEYSEMKKFTNVLGTSVRDETMGMLSDSQTENYAKDSNVNLELEPVQVNGSRNFQNKRSSAPQFLGLQRDSAIQNPDSGKTQYSSWLGGQITTVNSSATDGDSNH
ncbi:unnamed protein product [Caenorhabditis sp. 36 PRJEB53466]|nr:unnamed protein product [Caenorhabditis sp. 36 PRJEB53466]